MTLVFETHVYIEYPSPSNDNQLSLSPRIDYDFARKQPASLDSASTTSRDSKSELSTSCNTQNRSVIQLNRSNNIPGHFPCDVHFAPNELFGAIACNPCGGPGTYKYVRANRAPQYAALPL